MDGGIHVACRRGRWSGRGRRCASVRIGSVAAASASERCAATDTRGAWGRRGPTKGRREAASSDVCPHPDNWSRPANSSVSGNYWILLKGKATTGERPEVGFDLRKRGTRCDQVCADGRDRPCGDGFPSGGTGGSAPVVEHVAYLRQHGERATRYARKPCRVAAAMAYALRGMFLDAWCGRPCGDNSRSGMDGHGRGSATIYARRGTGFSVGAAGERRVGPDSGDSRRLLRPPMRACGQIKRD